MSSEKVIIQVKNLSKAFEVYDKPEDRLKQMLMPTLRSVLGVKEHCYHRKFWALHDISLEICKGQTVGIIGQNGSGKSTLLQIITGTMSASSGTVLVEGSIAALLELGSGFNPEFTGRENVYMNASLLGLNRRQTDEKFDYIAGFADIGEYLEQPVKTYSSGMMLRLAFAVQIAVETEILIIDEALAVGDARFQLKCFKRLEEIKAQGTTILFVSHATELVRSFCDHCLVLDKGKAIYWGDSKTATIKYLQLLFPNQEEACDKETETILDKMEAAPIENLSTSMNDCNQIESLSVDVNNIQGQVFGVGGASLEWLKIYGLEKPNLLMGGRTLIIRCQFHWQIDFVQNLVVSQGYEPNIVMGAALANHKGEYIFGGNGFDCGLKTDCLQNSVSTCEWSMTLPYLVEGEYFLTIAIALGTQKHHVQLRWHDCAVQLKSIHTDRNIFGIFAIDYAMKKIE